MQFDQIRDRIEALVKLGGWSNAIPEPDYAFLANEGLRLFTRETQHNIEDKTITTVVDQAVYSIHDPNDPREWIAFFDDALWKGTTSPFGSAWLSQTTRDRLRIGNRLWRQTKSGTPQWWYWAGPKKIGLYPPPSTANRNIIFEGPRHEPPLADDLDIPSFNEDYHEGVCLFGAWHWGKLHARGEERAIAEGYRLEALEYTRRYKESVAAQEAGLVQMRVARARQEYMNLGAKQWPLWWP